jgi:zinc transport system substrate-binding protein
MISRMILTLVCALTLAACSNGPGPADPGRLTVVTSFYPLAFAAERIGGTCVDVTDLTPPGVEPHDLELTPDGVEAIATADLVLYLGGGFQPAVQDALSEASGRTVDVLGAVRTLPGSEALDGAPAIDPHVWLDPRRFAVIAQTIGRAITSAGAAEECGVAGRASDLGDRLEQLDQAYRGGLASCELDVIVTSHAAFGYLADEYGLRQEAIAGLEPDIEPNPQKLAEIADLVRREHVSVIFTEELVSPDVAETLARETGARTEVLATIEGLTSEEKAAGQDYLTLMEENLDTLRSALGCS